MNQAATQNQNSRSYSLLPEADCRVKSLPSHQSCSYSMAPLKHSSRRGLQTIMLVPTKMVLDANILVPQRRYGRYPVPRPHGWHFATCSLHATSMCRNRCTVTTGRGATSEFHGMAPISQIVVRIYTRGSCLSLSTIKGPGI